MAMLKTRPPRPLTYQAYDRVVGKQGRVLVLLSIMTIFLLGGIGARLGYLQIVEGDRNRQMADENRIRLIPKPPERGRFWIAKGGSSREISSPTRYFSGPLRRKSPNGRRR